MKLLHFTTQGKPELQPAKRATGKNCFPVPTTSDRNFEPCGCPKAGSVALFQATRQVFRFALHFEQRKGEANRWIE
jgi:hypothetical protein